MLSEMLEKGKEILANKDFGLLLEGVETGFVLKNNRRIFEKFTFRQQAIDAQTPDLTCEVLGVKLATPIIMSAMTMPIPAIVTDGLLETAEGLKQAGSLMWTGTPVPNDLKALVDTGVPVVSTVKPFADRKTIFKAIEEIQKAGVKWVGMEVDVGWGTKIRDRAVVSDCAPLSSAELKEIKQAVDRPFILKGILSREDAEKAVDLGADGIVLSNHGAHTLDYLPHPFQVMDDIVEAVSGETEIMVDGGFRRGSDVLKGLAFGASLIGLGRPILYALAADGRQGVTDLIQEMTNELSRILGMVGAKNTQDVSRDILIEG
ncbi:MAG: alpha-hydroxy-acid oxidizing protein [Deltaproteobacteria bacterium]|nr:alpha-hydroxy-acid oxidizing protein [Deltaproteobacteria bacterium]